MTAARRLNASRQAVATIAVLYARVSTDEQQSSGGGIGAQLAECRAFAARVGWTVLREYVEPEAVSGSVTPLERPQLRDALAALDNHEAGILLARRPDRIARKASDLLALRDAADRGGWSFATTDGRVDTTTAAGRGMFGVQAVFAEMERDLIRERTREALAAKKAAGVRLGRPSTLPGHLLDRIATMRAGRATMRQIAEALNADGVPTARGGRWGTSSIQSALQTIDLNAHASQPVAAAPAAQPNGA